jgi:hypothetical protein
VTLLHSANQQTTALHQITIDFRFHFSAIDQNGIVIVSEK